MLGILFYCSAFSYLVIVMFQLSDLLNYNQVVETIRYWAPHCSSFSYSLVYARHRQHALFIYPHCNKIIHSTVCLDNVKVYSYSAAVTSCRYFAAFNIILSLYSYTPMYVDIDKRVMPISFTVKVLTHMFKYNV